MQAIAGVAAYLDGLQTRLGVPVIWVGPWLEPYFHMERLLAFDCAQAANYVAVDPAITSIFTRLDAQMDDVSRGHRYRYVSGTRAIGFDARYDIFDCSNIYWSDGDHFSEAGEARFGKRLFGPIMSELTGQATAQASR
jgi:hypothetical protein